MYYVPYNRHLYETNNFTSYIYISVFFPQNRILSDKRLVRVTDTHHAYQLEFVALVMAMQDQIYSRRE